MIEIALLQPEIPPNTGNIIRLCANTGATLHLIGRIGFDLDDARVRRAGLDYRELACVRRHACMAQFRASLGHRRLFAFSTRARTPFTQARFASGDVLLFGAESRGLPQPVLDGLPPQQVLRLPMRSGSRSLNLSNAVAVACYEAWRQLGFDGAC